jgi:hypothetical protein
MDPLWLLVFISCVCLPVRPDVLDVLDEWNEGKKIKPVDFNDRRLIFEKMRENSTVRTNESVKCDIKYDVRMTPYNGRNVLC